MKCTSCGYENPETAKFCSECGARAAGEATEIRDSAPVTDLELEHVRSSLAPRYKVTARIGQGGMGVVFKAIDPELERTIAIKVVPRDKESDAPFVERFRREARLAARLRHPRIVSIHEVGELGGVQYFTMDYVEGETLRSVVRQRGALPLEDALAIVGEIAAAVAHAHGKGVIHRDLKPENVMVDREGEVFVLDFGLARALQDPSFTQSGTVMGSPLYMSPEQLRGETVDARSDVFSVGLILYYCLTGEELFIADSITGIVAKQMSTEIPPLVERDSRIPPMLKEPLLLMLRKDRERRPEDMRVLVERLTLRRIVAIGRNVVEGTETMRVDEASSETLLRTAPAMEEVPVEDQPIEDEVSARRRKRLQSLLDDF